MSDAAPEAYRLLDPEQDKNLGFKPDDNYAFARQQRFVGLTGDELRYLVSIMPMLFRRLENGWLVLGVTGFLGGENLLLGPAGGWQAFYIPLALQLSPLVLDTVEDNTPRLGVRGSSPRLSTQHENKLLDAGGQTTEIHDAVIASLLKLHRQRGRLSGLAGQLFDAGLLRELQGKNLLAPANGQFYTVNPQALAELDSQVLAELRDSGALEVYFSVYNSAANVNRYRWIVQRKARINQPSAEGLDSLLAPQDEASFNFDI